MPVACESSMMIQCCSSMHEWERMQMDIACSPTRRMIDLTKSKWLAFN